MKNNLLSLFLFVVCAVMTQTLSQRVWAQTTASAASTAAGMTLDQLKAAGEADLARNLASLKSACDQFATPS